MFEDSRRPPAAKSVGTSEPTSRPETLSQEKDCSGIQPDLEETPVETPAAEQEAEGQTAFAEPEVSAVAAYNDRALRLFRDRDYEGALAELETALTLEPENRMLLANIKRVKKQLQGPAKREGDPWATS